MAFSITSLNDPCTMDCTWVSWVADQSLSCDDSLFHMLAILWSARKVLDQGMSSGLACCIGIANPTCIG